jgi:ribosome-associated heat shock protein Hsp15
MDRMTENRTGIRIDKWLWAARFFKTRALATTACEAGHILCNAQPSKPSRNLKTGDKLLIKNEAGEYEIEVLTLSDVRGSATIAQEMYHEGDESRDRRAKAAEARKTMFLAEPSSFARKPTKRDRRLIHSFRGKD